jgi:glycerol-3-phosphate acyltransferase PlsY
VVAAITGFAVLRFDAAVAITIIAVYVIVRHEANIQRLIARTEPRIGAHKSDPGK